MTKIYFRGKYGSVARLPGNLERHCAVELHTCVTRCNNNPTYFLSLETAIDASSPHVSLLHKIYEKSHLIPGSFVSRAPNAPESIWPDVSSRFNIPSHLFSEVFFKLYGFFWSGDVETENGNQKGHSNAKSDVLSDWYLLIIRFRYLFATSGQACY